MNRLRVAAALALLAGLVAWTASDVRRAVDRWRRTPPGVIDDVTEYDAACGRMRHLLPDRGRVGYRDLPNDGAATRRHALVQYALVPLLVEWQTDRTPAVVATENGLRLYRPGNP